MIKWNHRYKYKLKSSKYTERVGYIHTGEMQVERAYSNQEVEALAKEMAHGTIDDAVLIECKLIEVRK